MKAKGRSSKVIRSLPKTSDAPCAFREYTCSLARIDGYKYCIQHILEDKSAPFRQCNFIYPTSSKRCYRASPLTDRTEGFCEEHSNQAALTRYKASYKEAPEETPELYLNQLTHHLVDPSSSIKHPLPDPSHVPSVASSSLECAFTPDESSFLMSPTYKNLPRTEDDSEFEGATYDDDPLEHAGIYTTEEAAKIYLQKLTRLRAMYKDEFKNLFDDLKEGRKEYVQVLRMEKDGRGGSDHSKDTQAEQIPHDELRAMLRYHKKHGLDELLQKRLNEKRQKLVESPSNKLTSSFAKCIFSQGSWKCGDKSVPFSKFCFKHILEDQHQVLFQPCAAQPMEGTDECEVPVIPLPHMPTCIYHTPMPELNPMSPIPAPLALVESSTSISVSTNSLKISALPPSDVMEGDKI